MFRRVKSFNLGSSLRLDWDSFLENVFKDRFTAKAIWAYLVFPFSIYTLVP